MDHVLRQKQRKEEEGSVASYDRFGAVYSHDNESVMSNGQFKALESRDSDDNDGASEEGGNSHEEKRYAADYNDELTVQQCASGQSQQFQATNVCTNLLIETFQINPKELVVKILAFSIPGQDSLVEPCCEQVPLPGSPGFICVGRVMTQTPKHCDIQLNDRVMALLPVERDARFETYANVPFSSVFKVEKNVDAMTQVSLILTYLPALQILQTLPYKVKNKKVILNGGIGPVIRSLIQLCILHGAKKIYVPCLKKHREIVREIGGKTQGPKHSDWGPSFIGEVDLMVDAIGENSYVTSEAVLNKKGHLCIIGNTDSELKEKTMFNNLNKMFLDYRVSHNMRATVFSLLTSLEKDRASFIQDFEYLIELIDEGRIEPMFTRVSLDEYRNSKGTKATMMNSPLICDPWTEYKWG